MPEHIIEQAIVQAPGRLTVDRETGTVKGVKLLGPISRNGNIYTKAAMSEAASLYEGVEVYEGHHTRKYSDHLGDITEAHLEGDAIFGSIKFRPKHPLYESLLDDAEHRPTNLALSHEILDGNYEATIVSEGRRIDHIFKVDAFAVVKSGGTNKSLVEEDENMSTKEIKSLADLREAYPNLLKEFEQTLTEGLKAEQKDAEKLASVIAERDEVIKERDELQSKLDLIEAEKAKEERKNAILEEAKGLGLSGDDVSEDLVEQLMRFDDASAVTGFLKKIKPSEQKRKPESTSGVTPSDDSDKPFYLRGKN